MASALPGVPLCSQVRSQNSLSLAYVISALVSEPHYARAYTAQKMPCAEGKGNTEFGREGAPYELVHWRGQDWAR